jgi:hypothetical protein
MDANFRLQRKAVSNERADPALSEGLAYLVETYGFKTYLAGYDYRCGTQVCSWFVPVLAGCC